MALFPNIPGIPPLLDGGTGMDFETGLRTFNTGVSLLDESLLVLGPLAPDLLVKGVEVVNQGSALINRTADTVRAGVATAKRGLALVQQAQAFLGADAPTSLRAGSTATDAGVKQIEAASATDASVMLTKDGPNVANRAAPKWGIYDSGGAQIVAPDSVVDFDYAGKARISDYPIERGSFASYNKVMLPFDARVTMTKGGNDSDRAIFLAALETARQSIDLFSVVTPEIIYLNANVTGVDYRRSSDRGVTLLTAEIQIEEIREATTAIFTKTKTPSGAKKVSGGPVQAVPPRDGQIPPGGPR